MSTPAAPRTAIRADERRWRAVRAKDGTHDGAFVFAVRTTGVFCKPSCPARTPKRENVVFFADAAAAQRAGFRPCRRCKPLQPATHAHAAAIERACRLLDAADSPRCLDELADAAGFSRFHFVRVFKQATGLTPMAYQRAKRRERARAVLNGAASVTAAIYDAGFGSSSRFYAEAGASLGMTPTAYRRGGAGEAIRFATAPCALGIVLVAATGKGVCAIEFGDSPAMLAARLTARFPRAALARADDGFRVWIERIVEHVERPRGSLRLPLDVQGTAFQQRVWQALREIPAGCTATYGEVAARIGQPDAARAVAQACASNPVALAVPCHRVVRGDGALGGYRWGITRKRELLARESPAPLSAAAPPSRRDQAPAAAAPAAARRSRPTGRAD